MQKNNSNWNIAFEISPLLTASGSFGDKSGVFRYIYGFLLALIKELKLRDSNVKIVLFTFAPHNLKYGVCPELLELIKDKNVTLLDYQFELDVPVPHYNNLFDILEFRFIKKILKIFDHFFPLRDMYDNYSHKRYFRKYVKHLEHEFARKSVRMVFHSETGFYRLHGLINIITIYDLTTILFPEMHRETTVDLHARKIRFARNEAQAILAISQSTKNDLIKHSSHIKNKPIIVAYPGLDNSFAIDTSKIKFIPGDHPPLVPKRYLLFYGTFEPRKNISYIVRAFTELYMAGEIPLDYRLVLIGGNGWGKAKEQIINYVAENFPIITSRPVIVLNYAADQNLRSYIKHARAVLYPSLYEGFGLPILESMTLGTPVLTSNTSSIPEVGGNAALYVNPKDFFDIKHKMKLIIDDNALAKDMSQKGLTQSKKFSWESTINKVLEALKPNTLKSN